MKKSKIINYSPSIILNSFTIFWIELFIVMMLYDFNMNTLEGDYHLRFTNWEQSLLTRMDIVLSVWLLMQLAGLGAMNFVVYSFRHNELIRTILIVIFTFTVAIMPWMGAALFPIDLLARISF